MSIWKNRSMAPAPIDLAHATLATSTGGIRIAGHAPPADVKSSTSAISSWQDRTCRRTRSLAPAAAAAHLAAHHHLVCALAGRMVRHADHAAMRDSKDAAHINAHVEQSFRPDPESSLRRRLAAPNCLTDSISGTRCTLISSCFVLIAEYGFHMNKIIDQHTPQTAGYATLRRIAVRSPPAGRGAISNRTGRFERLNATALTMAGARTKRRRRSQPRVWTRRSPSTEAANDHRAKRFAGPPVRPFDQRLSGLRAWLRLLLCPPHPCVARPVTRTGFRDATLSRNPNAAELLDPRTGASPGYQAARHRHGHQHRPLSAR